MKSPRLLFLFVGVACLLAGIALARLVIFPPAPGEAAASAVKSAGGPPKTVAAAAAGTAAGAAARAAASEAASLIQQLPPAEAQRFAQALAQIRREYVDEVPDTRLLDGALRGLLAGLDSHSAYLDPREYEDLRRGAAGNYPGIGIEVAAKNGFIEVQRPLEDSPAARAGIRAGDLILRIDGEPVGQNVAAAIDQMRGPAGSLVRLTVRRAAADELVDVVLERARVEVHSVSGSRLEPRYAYLRIAAFSDTTPGDFELTVQRLRREQPDLRGVVIDLRNNPGGVLEAAVAVADAMLDTGNIVVARGRAADARFRMDARAGQLLDGVDIAVLVNGASASAAEIVAGALKDNGRALLVGRRTYGKGSVQSVIPLSDGHAIKLTTSRYATPSGAYINERGIAPDVALAGPDSAPTDPSVDDEVRAALRELQRRTPRGTRTAENRNPRA
ncbi:MAG: S41 family peptidase [Gammaproteobacteria bacterium]|nr:S41 family peptidase [Gammaproteobacteria bacterium]